MAPGYQNLQTTYPIDLNKDHYQPLIFPEDHNQYHQQYTHLFPMNNPHLQASSSSTSSSTYPNNCPIYFFNSSQDQTGYGFAGSQFQPYPFKQEVDDTYGSMGSYDQAAATLEINKKDHNNVLKFSISKKQERSLVSAGHEVDSYGHQTFDREDHQINSGGDSLSADQWMSSKMRLMKKMMKDADGNEQTPPTTAKAVNNYIDRDNNSTATIRVCADCNTTKTPLWRSGPRGPKTLCNACGIRQRKAKRAMAAAAANNSAPSQSHHHMSTIRTAAGNNHIQKKTSGNNGFGTQKKRSKLANKFLVLVIFLTETVLVALRKTMEGRPIASKNLLQA